MAPALCHQRLWTLASRRVLARTSLPSWPQVRHPTRQRRPRPRSREQRASGSPPGRWARLALTTPRCGSLDGRVLVVGGAAGDEENDTSAELYDPETGTWSATGSMVRPRGGFAFAAILLRDGKVLVGDEKGAEVFDPDVGTWTVTRKMALIDEDGSSHWGTPTLLRDGRVLVVHDGDISELYDPDSGTWTATGPLTPPVDIPTPVTLPDGKVLVAGGDQTVSRREPGRSVRSGHGHLDRHRDDGYASPRTPRGAAARWQGARGGRRQRRSGRYVRGGIRPRQRNLVRHREHAQDPHPLPGHIAARRQGARW